MLQTFRTPYFGMDAYTPIALQAKMLCAVLQKLSYMSWGIGLLAFWTAIVHQNTRGQRSRKHTRS